MKPLPTLLSPADLGCLLGELDLCLFRLPQHFSDARAALLVGSALRRHQGCACRWQNERRALGQGAPLRGEAQIDAKEPSNAALT